MSITTIVTVTISLTILLSAVLAQPDAESLLSSFSSNNGEQGPRAVRDVGDTITKVVADIKEPIETAVVAIASSQCSNVKKLLGVSYEEVEGEEEPDVNQLTLVYINNNYTITYNISTAASTIPEAQGYDPQQKLYIYIHGFTDDPSKASFGNVSQALLSTGNVNVLALDASSLIHWLYLRSSTYVRFIGEKLGEVLAAMVDQSGVDPAKIHVIGHSLGAHIASFTGKTFTNLTSFNIRRITGLDPAGPCFTDVGTELRLKSTDADFVDVIHTDAGVLGLTDALGDVDYFPNGGAQQPNCFYQSCSHSRAWMVFAESVTNPEGFPAIQCDSWEAFKNKSCEDVISYMGFPSEPGTTGKFYLQTAGESPYGLGLNGTVYNG